MRAPDYNSLEIDEEERLQRVEYVRLLIKEQEKVAQLAYRLSINTVGLCRGNETLVTGAYLFDWDLTTDEWVDIANDALGINLHTPGIEVLFVIPESPAEAAGLRPGDRIIRLNNWRVPSSRGAFSELHKRFLELNDLRVSSINLGIQRSTNFSDVTLYPIKGCHFPVILQEDESIGAFADGEKVIINRGMLRFIRNNDELSMVVAHEMAHNALGHIDAKRKNMAAGAVVGSVVDVLFAAATGIGTGGSFSRMGANIAALAYSKDFEFEADYHGAYIMAQAGFDFRIMPSYWRYIGSVDRDSTTFSQTHPTSVERYLNMREIVREIEEKQEAGRPLIPDY